MKKLILCLLILVGCKEDDNTITADPNMVMDIDGNAYHTVTIGTQTWMAENLKVTRFNDGTSMPLVMDLNIWISLTTPGYCWYDNNEAANKNIYGALYNWYAVNTGKLAPVGWHVPTDGEWKTLEMYLGMTQAQADSWGWRGTTEGGRLKAAGITHWHSPNIGATNSSDFTALPSGYRIMFGNFSDEGTIGDWWSCTESSGASAWNRCLGNFGADVGRYSSEKYYGFSVRCVKD